MNDQERGNVAKKAAKEKAEKAAKGEAKSLRVVEDERPEKVLRLENGADEKGQAESSEIQRERKRGISAEKIEARRLAMTRGEEDGGDGEAGSLQLDPEEAWKEEAEADSGKQVPMGWFFLLGLLLLGVVLWTGVQVFSAAKAPAKTAVPALPEGENDEAGEPLPAEDKLTSDEDAELHFIEIERVLKGFMEAETIEERAKYVRHPERVLPLMRDFYSRNEFQSRVYRGIRAYQNVPLDGLPFIAIEVKDSVGNFHPLLIEDGEEGVLIDWESHECFQPVSIEDYVRDRPTDPVSLRVYVSDDYFHSYEFQDKTEYASYRLKFRGSDAVLNGYVKRGTELDQKFRKLYPESHKGQWRPLILKVRFLEGGEARNSVLIEELQSQVWAYLRNPAEVASSEKKD